MYHVFFPSTYKCIFCLLVRAIWTDRREVCQIPREAEVGKVPGEDECKPRYLKEDGVSVMEWLVRIFDLYLDAKQVPEEWASACIMLLYKGNFEEYECNNSKVSIYWVWFIKRIKNKTDHVMPAVQSSFRRGRRCVKQTFVVRRVCGKFLPKSKNI